MASVKVNQELQEKALCRRLSSGNRETRGVAINEGVVKRGVKMLPEGRVLLLIKVSVLLLVGVE